MTNANPSTQLMDIATRIRGMREILGYSTQKMAEQTEVSEEIYRQYETGTVDLPFTFLHKCSKVFGLECGVCAAPDEVRGQVVKACIVLVKGTEGTEELKKEIQNYVKTHTAPYKYPRIVEFREELPKTISGKIQRNKL